MAVKLHQVHATDSRDIQNGSILSGQSSYIYDTNKTYFDIWFILILARSVQYLRMVGGFYE